METVTDREAIPRLDEAELIQLNETRLAKVGQSVISVIGALTAGVLAAFGLTETNSVNQATLVIAAAALFAASMLSWAIVAAADLHARGTTAAANLALRLRPGITIAAPGAAGTSAGLWAHIKNREKGDQHLVVDSRVDKEAKEDPQTHATVFEDKRLFLLARNDEVPTWYSEAEIDAWEVKSAAEDDPA